MRDKISGIYIITNISTGKSYIGCSVDIDNRWRQHRRINNDSYIHRSIIKHGVESFSFRVLLRCPKMCFDYWEKFYVSKYNTIYPLGYNLKDGGVFGCGYSEKTKKKISESLKGNKNALGVIRDLTTRKKMSDSHKGQKCSQKCKEMNTINKGNKNSSQESGKSGHKGIFIRVNGKFSVSIYVFGKKINGGVYRTLEEALKVRESMERQYRI